MNSRKKIRVALCQRICPDFRVGAWRKLSREPGIELTLFHGHGRGRGSYSSTSQELEFPNHCLWTIPLVLGGKYRVIHPGLVTSILGGGYDVVISEGLTYFPNSLILALACRLTGKPFVLYEAPPVGAPSWFRKLLSPIYLRLSSKIITYNSFGRKYFIRQGYPEDRITVALNTIDTDAVIGNLNRIREQRMSIEMEFKCGNGLVIGYLGALEKRKRLGALVKTILRMSELFPDNRCIIIGNGPQMTELQQMIPQEKKYLFSFLGRRISDAELYLQICDVVVLPSQGGLAIPHALTCGVPCIATSDAEGPGILDYLEDGVNGFILTRENLDTELEHSLKRISEDRLLLSRLQKGAELSSDRFSLTSMTAEITKAAIDALGRSER